MVLKSLASDDIFISYSRRDASTSDQEVPSGATKYVIGLVDQLKKKDFSCFTDMLGTEAGEDLPPTLLENLRVAKCLLYCAPKGRSPLWVVVGW